VTESEIEIDDDERYDKPEDVKKLFLTNNYDSDPTSVCRYIYRA